MATKSDILVVRLSPSTKRKLDSVSRACGQNKSSVARLAVEKFLGSHKTPEAVSKAYVTLGKEGAA